jgi:hypothetical protein
VADRLRINDNLVEDLRRGISLGESGLLIVPMALKKILRD